MQIIKILAEPLSIDAFWSVEFQTLNARKLRVEIGLKNSLIETSTFWWVATLVTIPGAFEMPDVQTAYSIISLLAEIWCLRP